MTRRTNYNAGSKKSRFLSQFIWILLAASFGYLLASLDGLSYINNWYNHSFLVKQSKPIKPSPSANVSQNEQRTPKLEFYTLLANQTASEAAPVEQPRPSSVPIEVTKAKPTQLNTVTAHESYAVQVASFKNKSEAERMKASLVMKGFEVSITPITQNQLSWFRVMIGPFSSKNLAQKAQLDISKQEHIFGMVKRVDV